MARVQMGETPGMHRPFFPLLLPLAMFLLEHPPPKKKLYQMFLKLKGLC